MSLDLKQHGNKNIEQYTTSNVKVYDRNGFLVFEKTIIKMIGQEIA